MKKLIVITAATGLGLIGTAVALPAGAAATPAAAPAPSIAWAPCPDNDPWQGAGLKGLECATLQVPLDYRRPAGRKIKLALSRAKHTDAQHYQGVVLLNRGGPGGRGRDLPTRFATGSQGLPTSIGAQYDWIGWDPRGVQASEPSVICDPSFQWPGHARPDYVPANRAEENAWKAKARRYAADCGRKYGAYLPFLGTRDSVADMESIRRALGQDKVNYFGYSYGTYLGQVYATTHPRRVRRMVLDSVVRASGAWYDDNLDQDIAFEKRMKIFFRWIARYDSVYHLGTTGAAVEKKYYKARARVKAHPLQGNLGPSEWDDFFVSSDGYRNYSWVAHAKAFSDFYLRNDPTALLNEFGPADDAAQNLFAMYTSTQCRDAAWPRNWAKWHRDNWRLYRAGNRALTWSNVWFNAACAYWPTKEGPAARVGSGKNGPNILLVQGTNDAATPYAGAVETHKLFKNSRFIVELGGNNHGVSLSLNANACLNFLVSSYLKSGTRPASRNGIDATCKANPDPVPDVPAKVKAKDLAGEPALR